MKAHQIVLSSRPKGHPTLDNFGRSDVELPSLGEGEVLVKSLFLSVDPYMRGRMNDAKSYVPPFAIDAPLAGGGVGEVIESNTPGFAVGDLVTGMLAWRDYNVAEAKHLLKIPTSSIPASAYLGILGMPGMTAYVGLFDLGKPKKGETVFVSGAGGAVGSAVGQMAKIAGAKVIGSAGGSKKCARLIEMGFDVAIDYKEAPIMNQLMEAATDGVDVYFDNVGGDHLVAALEATNDFARLVLCGAISQYNNETYQPGPGNLFRAIQRRLTITGFIVSDHGSRRDEFLKDVSSWISDGKLTYDETFVDGLENAPEAFMGLFSGLNTGKMVVRL
ncbi:NADP-dependent oxidoreductase [Acidithrix ferrooxidans]|uniref:Putative NADP-dependent oxidoreductase YfmJ n=1 Tax=Acidithrix ferrooxidans TaxID=1280514 RepID=A0A0D8HL85_9ACTN|nr:NADP-dependent oxidoreductase [Acidithrix ferrooxidans]KJF18634.1 putative NADP-dependent oxidoreductase YfmJ [Acidithrix ferrooxidans]